MESSYPYLSNCMCGQPKKAIAYVIYEWSSYYRTPTPMSIMILPVKPENKCKFGKKKTLNYQLSHCLQWISDDNHEMHVNYFWNLLFPTERVGISDRYLDEKQKLIESQNE